MFGMQVILLGVFCCYFFVYCEGKWLSLDFLFEKSLVIRGLVFLVEVRFGLCYYVN